MNTNYLVVAECIETCFGLCCKEGEKVIIGEFESEHFARLSAKAIGEEINKYFKVYVVKKI